MEQREAEGEDSSGCDSLLRSETGVFVQQCRGDVRDEKEGER